jgi:ring-1,2-phenylacetyl-CoA epoxidase subunit PaaE
MAFGLFKKKNKTANTDDRYFTLTIDEVRHIAKDAVNLIFQNPGEQFKYQPGQFITIIDEVEGKKIRRAYSLNSTPALDSKPSVTVKRVKDGIMSNHINDHYESGRQVEIMEPMGKFTIDYDPAAHRHAVFFGGGSGITPLYALIRTLLKKEPNVKIDLIYGNRSADYIIFKDELAQLADTFENFQLIHILEEDADQQAKYQGRPDHQMMNEILDQLDVTRETEYYICGPGPMMDLVTDTLHQRQVAEDKIVLESFEAGKTSPKEIIAEEEDGPETSEVTIILDDETHVLQMDTSTPVLEQGLDQDLDMPYSCQSGLCTACRGKCLEGDISTDDAEGLSQEELDEGYRLLCIGRPLTQKVKVEIG